MNRFACLDLNFDLAVFKLSGSCLSIFNSNHDFIIVDVFLGICSLCKFHKECKLCFLI